MKNNQLFAQAIEDSLGKDRDNVILEGELSL